MTINRMIKQTIHREATKRFSKISNDFIYHPHLFSNFTQQLNTAELLKNKTDFFTADKRITLVNALELQYQKAGLLNEQNNSLLNRLAQPNCFTVTTGHQLAPYGGPLFFVYKIIHTINLAKKLKAQFRDYDFLPVFWLASEDHDFAEIQQLHLFNDTLSWESEQTGAVGDFNLEDFQSFKAAVLKKFENDEKTATWLASFYQSDNQLAQATFKLVAELFQNEELIIIDGNNALLKAAFSEILELELKEGFSQKAVSHQTLQLENLGYQGQVHPRDVNLFYLENNQRQRIVKNGEAFQIGERNYSLEEIKDQLHKKPENFSPNVILRPLYQEFILPNLSYIGGGGEIAYWLQLKGVFDAVKVPFPELQIRNSLQLIDYPLYAKIQKLGLEINELFGDLELIKKEHILKMHQEDLQFDEIQEVADTLKNKLTGLIIEVDQGLKNYGLSEAAKIEKQIQQVAQKLIRHKKKQEESTMQQIDNVHAKFFPNNSLQERQDSLLEWIGKWGIEKLMKTLKANIHPEEKDFILLIDDTHEKN
jgi:bacillithiol biosynthesis cysteine-adding enzyme BshC